MTISNQTAELHVRQAASALQQGRPAEARGHLEAVTVTGRANIQIWLMLAVACAELKDWPAAEGAADAVLAEDPKVLRALIIKADSLVAQDRQISAIYHYRAAIDAAEGVDLPPGLAEEIARAKAAAERIGAEATADLEAKMARQGMPPGERSPRFRQALEIAVGRKDIFFHQPTAFFYPGLANVQYFDPADFAWAAGLEAETDAIREELRAAMEDMAGFRPYMNSGFHRPGNANESLIDKTDWSTLFLVENGKRAEDVIARCPRTWAAVAPALSQVDTIMPTVLFSLLKPGARILPHTGMFNTRLTCHLPLIVPPGCGFRVGNETREWEEGKLIIFDDSIEHTAWNDSDQDRVVLIFDIWRPDLSDRERQEIATLLQALQ